MIRIAIDAMGGDFAPHEQVKGTVLALEKDENFVAVLCGDEELLKKELAEYTYDKARVEILHAPEVITNDDVPTKAVRTKKDSSTVTAFRLLKEGKADAVVSSGATGAVLTAGVLTLGRIKGISRPALCPRLPDFSGKGTLLCDCGANLECKSVNLKHFAMMATAYAQAVCGWENPRVGLLNNGTEDHKGDEMHREANELLKNTSGIKYVGNVEGRDIMMGDVDIVVSDGYTGNIALKSIEGCGKAISGIMKREFKRNLFAKLRALLVLDVVKKVKKSADYETMGGAVFLGLTKPVVKAHGNTKALCFSVCIEQAVNAVKNEMVSKIEKLLAENAEEESAATSESSAAENPVAAESVKAAESGAENAE